MLFIIMSTIWGLTWIAIKTGVDNLPPFFFAASRLLAAGSFLTLLAKGKGGWRKQWPRLVIAALLVNTVCYGSLFWGMQYVPSGISAVVNLALIPVGLFVGAVWLKQETFSQRMLFAILLGVFGLGLLFTPAVSAERTPALAGMAALVVGTLAYCWGSILSRPLLEDLRPVELAGFHNLIGGAGLLLLSVLFEAWDGAVLGSFFRLPVLASWLFLVLGGSVTAFTIFLGLLRDWGPSRAGLYAFVSPVVALGLGVAVFGESVGAIELIGSAVMLAAAAFAIHRPTPSPLPAVAQRTSPALPLEGER